MQPPLDHRGCRGPTSAGVCQRCHETREFKNYLGTEPSSKEIPAAQSSDKYPEMATATAGDGDENEDL